MQLECVDEPTIASLARQGNDPGTMSSSGRNARTKTTDRAKLACMACRRDNKKCEDQRPCSRCVTRAEECVHVGRGPKLVKLRCAGCRRDNKRCEDARPCQHCIDKGEECVDTPRRGRGHGTRVKAACTNCRRDKIRCDGGRPCSACSRKALSCMDRACVACSQQGNASECTHRERQDDGLPDEASTSTLPEETSNDTPPSYPRPFSSASGHDPQPPSQVHQPQGSSSFGMANYPPLPHHQMPPPIGQYLSHGNRYSSLGNGASYMGVIDPSITYTPSQAISSERMTTDRSTLQGSGKPAPL
ncbi:hypothetical protein JAAARDRAFT_512642 [Jaapia argillacea MUCL 33604]|uniref:Transcription activator of gluconeogenesis ERT1 n=1 Tax=Jaapia argillacea MUCL 33604 TaxID=933084 RepID=A0A067QFY8_9AGAM|nr:hypothetical protein JAAARDRAFT_512642 [Jaapia argillacea MUCL 33604]